VRYEISPRFPRIRGISARCRCGRSTIEQARFIGESEVVIDVLRDDDVQTLLGPMLASPLPSTNPWLCSSARRLSETSGSAGWTVHRWRLYRITASRPGSLTIGWTVCGAATHLSRNRRQQTEVTTVFGSVRYDCGARVVDWNEANAAARAIKRAINACDGVRTRGLTVCSRPAPDASNAPTFSCRSRGTFPTAHGLPCSPWRARCVVATECHAPDYPTTGGCSPAQS
jgi:hypothetical protein